MGPFWKFHSKQCHPWRHIHKSQHFIFFLTINGPNKVECYMTLGWKCLPEANSLAYWTICKKWRKWSVVNTVPGICAKILIWNFIQLQNRNVLFLPLMELDVCAIFKASIIYFNSLKLLQFFLFMPYAAYCQNLNF